MALAPNATRLVADGVGSSLRTLKGWTPERVEGAQWKAGGSDHYGGVVVGAATIGARSLLPETYEQAQEIMVKLTADEYSDYVDQFIRAGRDRAGDSWSYSDIVTVLVATAQLVQPQSYLEIGVRRGRSMAMVGALCPTCSLLGIDLWVPMYAGMDNPGPDFVRDELKAAGHVGQVELLSGDSHRRLPELFLDRPDLTFDVITVDGDHSPAGAERDLRDVLPRLRIGGVVVFDDIHHPAHPTLRKVWDRVVAADARFSTWEYDDVGFGVAVGVRRW